MFIRLLVHLPVINGQVLVGFELISKTWLNDL